MHLEQWETGSLLKTKSCMRSVNAEISYSITMSCLFSLFNNQRLKSTCHFYEGLLLGAVIHLLEIDQTNQSKTK